ncbi:hypothetical protein B1B_15118, partial [mine drainage metagenome]
RRTRPWFPLSFAMYTETLPSAVQRYPYWRGHPDVA